MIVGDVDLGVPAEDMTRARESDDKAHLLLTHTRRGIVEPVQLPEETVEDVIKRLRRVEGQIRGVQQMLADCRDCRDVVTQISAASKALDQAGFVLVAAGLTWCLEDPERSKAEGYDLSDVKKMFTKLA
jgi:DNA-binding FrmR family transcriptional regulator